MENEVNSDIEVLDKFLELRSRHENLVKYINYVYELNYLIRNNYYCIINNTEEKYDIIDTSSICEKIKEIRKELNYQEKVCASKIIDCFFGFDKEYFDKPYLPYSELLKLYERYYK